MTAIPVHSVDPAIAPLLLLLSQAERERDERAMACRHASSALQRALGQQRQLVDYRAETEARWQAQFRIDGRIELLHCYREFIVRLNQAIEQQRYSCAQAQHSVDQAQAELREAETRVAAVRKLIERRSAEARRAAERLEQKRADEVAARMAWQRPPGFAESRSGSLG